MISHIYYVLGEGNNPYVNLALEETLLRTLEPDACILYLWQNRNTVVIGKNQNAWKECRIRLLQDEGGFLARRGSGGGAVYHDLGNLNFTFIAHNEDFDKAKQSEVIVRAVRSFGIDAEITGRNDLTVNGRKFSGSAYYSNGFSSYHHGTLMLDVDAQKLERYLNVSEKKLRSKGVDSVRSRVVNLSELRPDLTVERLGRALIDAFGKVYGHEPKPLAPDDAQRALCGYLSGRYSSWDWLYGKNVPFEYECSERYDWGEVCVRFGVDGGRVKTAEVFSDSMYPRVVDAIPPLLEGKPFSSPALAEALEQLENRLEDEQEVRICSDVRSLLLSENY